MSMHVDDAPLATALGSLSDLRAEDRVLVIIDRVPDVFTSTFTTEKVTCDGTRFGRIRLLLKWSRTNEGDDDKTARSAIGCRDGFEREARVYQDVLPHTGLPTPRCFGVVAPEDGIEHCLVLEYLEDAVRITQSVQLDALERAAAWAGDFHRWSTPLTEDPSADFLPRYTSDFYIGWIDRTLEFSARGRYPWLPALCDAARAELPERLVSVPAVIVHGEYHPANVLIRQGTVYPVDWETAARAAGEIDLASLTYGYSSSDAAVARMGLAYSEARWPDGAPQHFADTLTAACMYVEFRWLGHEPDWTIDPAFDQRFRVLHALAESLSLL